MANEKSAANIPDLKKKENERKKAGAAWSGARGATGEFSGATGGNAARAAASAAGLGEGAGALGAEGGGFFGAIARFLAGIADSLGLGEAWAAASQFFSAMASTLLGQLTLGAAALSMIAAAGLLGYTLMKGKGGDSGMGASIDLGGIAGMMRVRPGGGDRLGGDSKGEIRFDPVSASKPAEAPPTDVKTADGTPAPGATPAPDSNAGAGASKAASRLAQSPSAADGGKATTSLGGGFAGKNTSAGSSAVPRLNSNLSSAHGGSNGRMSAMKSGGIHSTPSARSVQKYSAHKAFGQLKGVNGLSMQGAAGTSVEGMKAGSIGAFDQQKPTGGALATPAGGGSAGGGPGGSNAGSGGGQTPSTLGPGAADVTGGSGLTGTNGATPTATAKEFQYVMNNIDAMIAQYKKDEGSGSWLGMGLGLLEVGVGAALTPALPWVGVPLIATGVGTFANNYNNVFHKGPHEEQEVKDAIAKLDQNINDPYERKVLDWCTDDAMKNGTALKDCNPPEYVTNKDALAAAAAADIRKTESIQTDTPVPAGPLGSTPASTPASTTKPTSSTKTNAKHS